MSHISILFITILFLFVGCKDEQKLIKGKVMDVKVMSMGHGEHRKQIFYSFDYNNNIYEGEEMLYFSDKNHYKKNDSVYIKIDINNPKVSSLFKKVKKNTKKLNVLKLESH